MRPLLALVIALCAAPVPALAGEVTVFAAASLKNALDAVASDWQAKTGHSAVIAYDGSAKLAKQIQQGAPADVFVSAAVDWMDVLQADGAIIPESRRNLLGNSLVLVAHGVAAPVTIVAGMDLKGLLAGGKLAMGQVDSVPAGQYGKAALESLGIWASVQADVAQVDNVRAALALVAQGEAPLGIVYASDAIADDAAANAVSVIGTFPPESHPPIVFPAALIADRQKPEAQDFLDFLTTPSARAIFEAQGFTVLE